MYLIRNTLAFIFLESVIYLVASLLIILLWATVSDIDISVI
jgi:hypothetical protein